MRTKVVALLVSLVALWSFAAFVTVREGLNLLWVSTLDRGVAEPNEVLLPALQDERRLTMVFLGNRDPNARARMVAARERTDAAAATFRDKASAGDVQLAASPTLQRTIQETFGHIDALAVQRARLDSGGADRATAASGFTAVTDSIFRLYDAMATLDDDNIAKDARTLIQLTRAREVLAREDALLAGVLAAGSFTSAEHYQFVQLVGAQRFLYGEAMADLPEPDRVRFTQIFASPTFTTVRALEDRAIAWLPGQPLPLTPADWDGALRPAFDQVHQAVLESGDGLVGRATPVAIGVLIRLALAGVLGLIAVIASVVISITTARALVRQLERLRTAARDLAAYRLPRVVDRLQHGEKVDVEHEAPPLDFGDDEIGQVGHAFNAVQETAVRVAVEQAELRRSVRDVFLSLARRSQALLHRQLGLLDAMERRSTDAEELAELFRVDHLATRMRRNAENLIVLSGATAGRVWRRPVPIVDVVRAALAEVEDYTRVSVLPLGSTALAGRAVGDIIHLLAELIENAVSFSPPQTVVRVGGSMVGNGFAIEIEDRGLGMTPAERATANEQLRQPPEFKLTSTARLGHYVVATLAARHGVRVRLIESPYGGTTAIVILPITLIADGELDGVERLETDLLDGRRPVAIGAGGPGRHRSAADREADRKRGEPANAAPEPGSRRPVPSQRVTSEREIPLFTDAGPNGMPPAPATVGAAPAAPPAAPPAALTPPVSSAPPRLTPSGLPWRQRPPRPQPAPPTPPSAGRGAAQIRDIMSSYRSGTLRGRADAALLAEADPMPAPPRPPAEPAGFTEVELDGLTEVEPGPVPGDAGADPGPRAATDAEPHAEPHAKPHAGSAATDEPAEEER